jgi:hypothetical protein
VELGAATAGTGALGCEVVVAEELEAAGGGAVAGSQARGEAALEVVAAAVVGDGLKGTGPGAALAGVSWAVVAVGVVVGLGRALWGGALLVLAASLGYEVVNARLAVVVAAPVRGAEPGVGVVFVGLDVLVGTGVAALVGSAGHVYEGISCSP